MLKMRYIMFIVILTMVISPLKLPFTGINKRAKNKIHTFYLAIWCFGSIIVRSSCSNFEQSLFSFFAFTFRLIDCSMEITFNHQLIQKQRQRTKINSKLEIETNHDAYIVWYILSTMMVFLDSQTHSHLAYLQTHQKQQSKLKVKHPQT